MEIIITIMPKNVHGAVIIINPTNVKRMVTVNGIQNNAIGAKVLVILRRPVLLQ